MDLKGYLHQENSCKKELQHFNRVNNPIQNLLSRASGGTALNRTLLCDWVSLGQNL